MRANLGRVCASVLALAVLAFAVASAGAQQPKQRAVLKGLTYAVDTMAISPNGMLLAASDGADGKPVLVTFAEEIPAGAKVK